jgi:membrane protease YdiL (CAAX protease family)
MTYRSHLILKQLRPTFNLLLSWPESIARLALVGFCLLLAWFSGLPAAELGLTPKNIWPTIGLGLGIGLVTQLGVNLATQQAIKYFGPQIYSPWLIRNILPRQTHDWLLVALAFLPPVAMEELLFRTLLIGGFQTIIPLPLLILATSVIFGLMHLPQGKLGVLISGVINVLFCWLFIWSGQLLLTLAVHYTINLLQLITAYFLQPAWLDHSTVDKTEYE